ncbi:DUF6292 family protein [Pseudonocardia acidicola]|uniref:STAS domain-containing protein n=1 Tax=Pseudonocardia acidicola TaxID=2724939 RepID=A0ABX1SC65_9PSEU|nr:DUF6292 family protein [Pseudonocardia acidicola]NMH99160.1 STAS domain-containing protein [Pseudonocardia acidicola]
MLHDRSLPCSTHPPLRRARTLARRLPGLLHGFPELILGSPRETRRGTEGYGGAPPSAAGRPSRWFDVTVHRPTGTVAVLRAAGTLDSHTAPLLEVAVEEQVSTPTQVVVVDLRDVDYFGGSGLRCLMRIRALAGDAWLRVVCHRRPVGQALTVLGLADALDLYPDLELALAGPDHTAPTGPVRLSGLTRAQPPATAESAALLSNHVHIAVLQYLEAVAGALNRRDVAVSGVETITASEGLFGGRLGLGRNRVGAGDTDEVVELRWDEIGGWEVALRPHRERPRKTWRFLGEQLAPSPHHVSAFTDALLRGADVGVPESTQFRSPDEDLHALVALLETATARPEPLYLQHVGYPPR